MDFNTYINQKLEKYNFQRNAIQFLYKNEKKFISKNICIIQKNIYDSFNYYINYLELEEIEISYNEIKNFLLPYYCIDAQQYDRLLHINDIADIVNSDPLRHFKYFCNLDKIFLSDECRFFLSRNPERKYKIKAAIFNRNKALPKLKCINKPVKMIKIPDFPKISFNIEYKYTAQPVLIKENIVCQNMNNMSVNYMTPLDECYYNVNDNDFIFSGLNYNEFVKLLKQIAKNKLNIINLFMFSKYGKITSIIQPVTLAMQILRIFDTSLSIGIYNQNFKSEYFDINWIDMKQVKNMYDFYKNNLNLGIFSVFS